MTGRSFDLLTSSERIAGTPLGVARWASGFAIAGDVDVDPGVSGVSERILVFAPRIGDEAFRAGAPIDDLGTARPDRGRIVGVELDAGSCMAEEDLEPFEEKVGLDGGRIGPLADRCGPTG